MKKYIFLISSIIVSAILIVGIIISEMRDFSEMGIVFGILLGLSLPVLYKLFFNCLDINSWQVQLRQLRRENVLKRNEKVEVVFNYFYRIKVKDRYLLIPKAGNLKTYQPVGGNYKYNNDEKLFLDKNFSINTKGDNKMDSLLNRDYQIYVFIKDLKKIVNRFSQTKNRELINDLSRSFKEQLVKNDILEFEHLQYRYCGRYITSLEKNKQTNCYELFFTDIVEVIPDKKQEKILNELCERKSEKYYFANSKEIHLNKNEKKREDRYVKIDNNSIKILQESEKELNMHEKNVNCIYDIKLDADDNLEKIDVLKTDKSNSLDKDIKELPERRGNRFVGVLSLLVITGTIFSVVFKIMIKVINVWPTKGMVYQYFQLLISIVVTSLVIVIFRAVQYCLLDLQRYDVKRTDLHNLDEKSDNSYSKLIWYFKFCLVICVFGLALSSPIVLFDEGTMRNLIIGIIAIVGILLIVAAVGTSQVIKVIKNHEFEIIKNIAKDVVLFIIAMMMVYSIGLLLVISQHSMSTIEAEFSEDGKIIINLETPEDNVNLTIQVYDINGKTLWKHRVKHSELLMAWEGKYINGNIDETKNNKSKATLINNENIFSFYRLDINGIMDSKEGNYKIVIVSRERSKKVILTNSFLHNNKFTYCKEKMEKQY